MRKKEKNLYIVIMQMYLSLIILLLYNNNNNEYQFREIYKILNIKIIIGLDGINFPLLILTTIIIPIIIIIREKYNKEDINFQKIIILIEIILILIFLLLDIFYFYTLFELILIPFFIIIIKYGSRYNKYEAAYRLFIYTFIGSIFFFISIFINYIKYGSTFNEILELELINEENYLIWMLFFISFAIKIPIYPFHLWLPEAHTEAPTSASILLASLLLKIGIFGFIRYNLSLLGILNIYFSPFVYTLSIISIFYSCFITLRLIDLKKIIAYSSIIHMNFVILALFSFDLNSYLGSYFTLISHAFISSGLFLMIGILYRRYFSRNLFYFKGLANLLPFFSLFFSIFIFSNISLPSTSSFPGEFLMFLGILKNSFIIGIILLISLLFATTYNILFFNKLLFGQLSSFLLKFKDLSKNELLTLTPFLFFNFFLGLYSSPLLHFFSLPLSKLLFLNNSSSLFLISTALYKNYYYLFGIYTALYKN
jgi:NADH-quinone oxidoreductase subunit M